VLPALGRGKVNAVGLREVGRPSSFDA
jgi:hypothetical protein